jgi:hypothetical protein
MKQSISMDGYLKVQLRDRGRKSSIEVNRLMALTFIDKNYIDKGLVCDHINRDRSDNYLNNLRVVTQRANSSNTNRSNELMGAYHRSNGKWQSSITVNGKQIYLGTFDCREEAHLSYMNYLELLTKKEIERDGK